MDSSTVVTASPDGLQITAARKAYSVEEAANVLGFSRGKLMELIKEGVGPVTFNVGRRVLIMDPDLDAWALDWRDNHLVNG
jgi:excisionase family DNA binding protein